MGTETSNIQKIKELIDKLQFLGMIRGPQQYFVQFLLANPGLAGSLGTLVDKINKGTDARNDYIAVAQDIASLGASLAGFASLVMSANPFVLGTLTAIGLGLGLWHYLDSLGYDGDTIKADLEAKLEELSKYLSGDEERILTEMLVNSYNPSTARYDPLILDLNGDGVKTISQQTSKAFFDLSGDGMSEQTGWVDSNDGLLVFDKNSNGKIDDVNELFGNTTQSGFSMLKQLFDANSDNLIDNKDINFSQLKVWQDINGDGISQENELKTLTQLGISSINLNSTSTNVNSNGNTIKATSSFTQNGFRKSIKNSRFYKADFLDLNPKKVA